MAVVDPRGEAVLRGAEEARRQAETRRAADVARGDALARELPSLQAEPDGATTLAIAQTLCEAEGLTPEGRLAFLLAVSSGEPAAANDPGAALRERLEACYPPGSESRAELGAAIARRRGEAARGEAARGDAAEAIAAEAIARATALAPAARAPRASPVASRDGMERVRPASLFETAHGARAPRPAPRTSAMPAVVVPSVSSVSPPVTSIPSLVPSVSSTPSLLSATRAAFPAVSDSLLVTGAKLDSVAVRFEAMRSGLEKARLILGDGSGENVRVRYGLRKAGEALTSVEAHVVTSESRLMREVVPGRSIKSLLGGLAEAQGELRAVGPWAEVAHGELADVVGMAQTTDVRAAIGEIDAVAWEALAAERELGVVEGQASVLADAASPAVAPEESASSSPAEPSADSEAEPGIALTEDDLRLLGSGLDPSRPAPQILWTEESVNATCEQGRAQGGVTDAEGQAHLDLAQRLLAGATAPVELGAADIAAVLKEAGVPLETVDPQQLESAARYVNTAQTTGEQADKLRKAVDSFQTLSRVGAPKLTRQEMVNELWAAAKVPSHALGKLSDSAVAAALQQVRAALNGGPGEHQIKVGSYTLKLGVGANGALKSTSCKKPGFFSKVGSFLKKAVPIALTVMSFIPATAVFARIAQGAISLVKSIQAKSVLGVVTSAASLVAGGAAAVAKRAAGAAATVAGKAASLAGTTAQRVADVAGGVSRALQGVSNIRQGSVLGGLAAIGSGVAAGIGSFAKGVGDGFSSLQKSLNAVSTRLAQAGQAVSTVEGYRAAGRAVSEAKAALRQAEASGDRVAIAAAREGLARAESAKTSAVLGSVASAASLAADVRASYAKQSGDAVDTPPAKLTLDVALRTAWRGLNVARGIHDGDYAAAGVSALGLAAVGRQAAGKEPANKLGFTDAANLADAALGAHQAGRGEAAANTSVEDAERALRVARYTGDPAAIRQAEANLAQARKAREGALMGGIAANESLLKTAEAIGEKRQASRATGEPTPATVAAEEAPEAAAELDAADGPPDETAPTDAATAAASTPMGVAVVEKGMTVWEISQLTGVPVERILEFNAQQGQPVDPARLKVGQEVLVPLGESDRLNPPKTVAEVRSMQQAALAARQAGAAVTSPQGLPSADASVLREAAARFQAGDLVNGARLLQRLVDSGGDEAKATARQALGQLEAEHLHVMLGQNSRGIEELTAAAVGASSTSWVDLNPVTSVQRWLGQEDAVRTVANERQQTLLGQTRGIQALEGLRRSSGLTTYEVAKMSAAEREAALARANPNLDAVALARMKADLNNALGHSDVAALVANRYGSFSWDTGRAVVDTSFARGLTAQVTHAVTSAVSGSTARAGDALGDTVRTARANADSLKADSSFLLRAAGHYSAATLDAVSAVNRFTTERLDVAREFYLRQGGTVGAVGGALTTAGGIAASIVTAPLTLADHRASDSERTQALVTTALMLATGGLARAAKPALTYVARGVAARVPAAGAVATSLGAVATRVGQVARIDLGEAAAAGGRFVLRTGAKAADALPANALGQSIRAANQRLLAPLVRQAESTAVSVGRTADWAKDYFALANNFGKGPVMTTGARVLQRTGLAEVQARHAAEKAYATIRQSTDDVARIAKATGRTEAEIQQIKSHLFHDVHRTAKGLQRLDADPQIAQAWQRLKAGAPSPDDLRFIQHELAESSLVRTGMSQKAAHEAVEAFLRGETTSTFSVGRTNLSRAELTELRRLQGIEITNTTGAGAARPPRHHVFVQEHRDWFKVRGVDVDKYTLELAQGEHSALHRMDWNGAVQRFIDAEASMGRQWTRREILRFGANLRRQFGLQDAKVVSYGG